METEKKQVWLTPQVLTFFNHMRGMKPEWFHWWLKLFLLPCLKQVEGWLLFIVVSDHFKKTFRCSPSEDIILTPEEDRITLKT